MWPTTVMLWLLRARGRGSNCVILFHILGDKNYHPDIQQGTSVKMLAARATVRMC